MKYIFSITLISCAVLSVYLGIHLILTQGKKHFENRLFFAFCLASAIWGFGFGGLILQTDTNVAYRWRVFGMIGVFLYLTIAQILVCHMSNFKKSVQQILIGISLTGFIIYFFVIQKEQVMYHLDDITGMTYRFKPGFWNTAYTTYSCVVAANIVFSSIHILRTSSSKRIRAFCRMVLITAGCMVFGMVFDTICPLLGIPALPGSSITQFIGLVVLYNATTFLDRSRINITNMSEFIYYSLAMPVLVYDSDWKLQILNDAAYSFFDIPREQTDIEDIDIPQLFNLTNDDVFSFDGNKKDIDAICQKNWLYCNLAISEINDSYDDTIGYLILVTDLSERMNTMQDLEEAIVEAERATQAKSTFLANMSHEIRTPMNAIIGFSELVLKMDIAPEVREYVQDIKWSSHNLLAIINDILDISKIESGKMELICGDYYTGSMLNDVSLIIASQARKKGLAFSMNIDSNIPRKLYGDKTRVRGVLVNILNNAVKYTPEGSVTFEANIKAQTEDTVTLEFKVTDTGIGIKEEDLPVLFKSFQQLDQKFHYDVEGSGLGLAIVNGYVNLMGGEITVDSVYGEGSTFTVVFDQKIVEKEPLGRNFSPDDDPSNSNSIGTMKVANTRVLVVDDNLVNLKVASSSLTYYGLSVDTAANGPDAIKLCQENQYHIVFLDQMMPEMDGIEAMKEIRKISPHYAQGGECKLIVLTANAVSGIRNHLMKEGFDEYLGKPMNFKQLERLFVRFLPAENIYYEEDEPATSDDATRQEQDLLYLKESLPDIDTAQGISNCGGQLNDYLNVLQIAWNYGEKQLKELKELHDKQDYETYTIKVHSMKSMTRNLGANTISDMAKRQEEAGLNKENAYIDTHMEEFQTIYHSMLEKIEVVLRHYGYIQDSTPDTEKEFLTEEMSELILVNIRQCIDAFDFTKIFDILAEVENYQMSEAYEEVFSKIAHWMDELNVDEIRALIEQTLTS